MVTPSLIDFDFDAAIAEKNKFARRPVEKQPESPIDLATADALNEVETEASPQAVRLLIAVEKADYRAYFPNLGAQLTKPKYGIQQSSTQQNNAPKNTAGKDTAGKMSYADAQILNAASVWTQHLQAVAIFSCYSKTDYSEVCSLGIRLIGSGLESESVFSNQSAFQSKHTEKAMLRLVADFCPTHIIMSTPNLRLLNWANRHHIESIVLTDNWHAPSGRQQRQQHKQLVKRLNCPQVKWIGSRGVSACQAMASSGVAIDKLIPWEWPRSQLLSQHPPKALNAESDCTQLLYSGTLDSPSRVRDLLTALNLLQQKGHQAELKIVLDKATPKPALDSLVSQSQQLNITEAVTLVFIRSVEQFLDQVRAADVVVIPGYVPEADSGAEPPLIIQVASAACTPIVACDRADLEAYLTHGNNAMIFPEGNERSMVHRLERLMGQPQLYAQLSEASRLLANQQNTSIAWQELIEQWISDRPNNKEWLSNHTFSSSRYQQKPSVA